MTKKKVKKVAVKKDEGIVPGATGFIALNRSRDYVRNKDGNVKRDRHGNRTYDGYKWNICGSDIHSSIEKARACGCADNQPVDVAVLEVAVVAQHNYVPQFVKQSKIALKFNDK